MEQQRFRLTPTRCILLGMAIGAGIGLLLMLALPAPAAGAPPSLPAQVLSLIGDLFLRLLKMILIPLLLGSLVSGVTRLGDRRAIGRLGAQTLLFYAALLALAVVTGLVLANLIHPGRGMKSAGRYSAEVAAAAPTEQPTLGELVLRIVPENPVQALVAMDIPGILFFALFLGLALLSIDARQAEPLVRFFESLNAATRAMTELIMRLAPLGMGALIAGIIVRQTPARLGALLQGLGLYAVTVLVGLALQIGLYLLIAGMLGRVNPYRYMRQMGPALAMAFGTASSNATLPVTLHAVLRARISHRIAGFVVPLGATLNMSGTALFEAVAALFIAEAYGISLGPGAQATVAITAVFAAVGSAGMPCAGLVTLPIVLSSVGIPLQGMALVLTVDRVLDMCRTVVNVMGSTVACRVVQTWNPHLADGDE